MSKPNDNRTRTSIPILGLDTATPDLPAKDGTQETLHNLRHSGGAWRSIKPLAIKRQLHPAPGFEEQFSKLTIRYRHPASDEDVYIASTPNTNGTINLQQVIIKGEILAPITDDINPVYIYARVIEMHGGMRRPVISIVSLRPVTSDISVEINYTRGGSDEILSTTLTILKGATESTRIGHAIPTNNTAAKPTPESDASYKYMLFQNKESAEKFVSGFAHNLPADIRISHFGNILVVNDNSTHKIYYFRISSKDKLYHQYSIPPPPTISMHTTYTACANDATDDILEAPLSMGYSLLSKLPKTLVANNDVYEICLPVQGVLSQPPVFNTKWWQGEICYFAAFEYIDGHTTTPSALNIAASELPYCDTDVRQSFCKNASGKNMSFQLPKIVMSNDSGSEFGVLRINILADENANGYNSEMRGWIPMGFLHIPQITITIPNSNIDNELIKNINIYATRINPIWDIQKFIDSYTAVSKRVTTPIFSSTETIAQMIVYWNMFYTHRMGEFFANNNLAEQPFYLIKSIPINEFKSNHYKLAITGDLFKDIESKSVYQPTNNNEIYATQFKEYNNRAHFFDTTTTLFDGFGTDLFNAESDVKLPVITQLKINGNNHVAVSQCGQLSKNKKIKKIISYPDFRAHEISQIASSSNAPNCAVKLKQASAINFAYHIQPIGSDKEYNAKTDKYYQYVKYSTRYDLTPTTTTTISDKSDIIYTPNYLYASALNNPFVWPLDASYAIGTDNNRIRAINSAAIEMSDAKFGEFPLYVFTDEGIFALQSGNGEVLYSAVVPLNYDRIINPETLAVNYNILYITSRGLHALFSNQSTLLSGPINTADDQPRLDFLSTARLCYQHKFGEVILYNPAAADNGTAYPYAYVFSLNSKTWSTRDFSGYKLNIDEIVKRIDNAEIELLDLNNEQTTPAKPVGVRLLSRPLKLGSTEFKRLETLTPRWSSDRPQPVRLVLEGSVDLKAWMPLRTLDCSAADRSFTLRRTPFSFRFLRIRFDAAVPGDFELSGFDAEYYLRFLHRMR